MAELIAKYRQEVREYSTVCGTGPAWRWPGMALAQVRERKGKKEPLLDQAFRGKQDFTGMKY